MTFEYEKVPAEIYRQSFATIAAEADFSEFNSGERSLVTRLIHACGMVDLAADVVISPRAIEAGVEALERGADIICDVEMVRRGIISCRLAQQNNLLCAIADSKSVDVSNLLNTTRSAGAIEVLKEHIPGSIVAIGNAPTALLHLLELLIDGLKPPALIIGCPVGFVGAVESKEALIEVACNKSIGDIPFITVRGRRGGSAMAAAAVNALAGIGREANSNG